MSLRPARPSCLRFAAILLVATGGRSMAQAPIDAAPGGVKASKFDGAPASADPKQFLIDLPTALRLAGADNLDVRIAQERVREAKARHEEARLLYFPWLTPGFGYRGHDGNVQDIGGAVFEANKQSYTAGVGLNAQLNIGEAIYQSLAARQRARAAEEEHEASRQEAVFRAAVGYFDLSRAIGALDTATDAVRISEDYARQVREAVAAGIAFRGDAFRTEIQVQKNRSLQRQREEQRRTTAARLAETLRLSPATDLALLDPGVAPISLVDSNAALGPLVAQALSARPELRRSSSLVASAEAERRGTVRGPWIPTLGAQAFLGGLGGGQDDHLGSLGDTEDYFLGLSWRIGPGGLFDRGRLRVAESRHRASLLEIEQVRRAIERQVVEAHARCRSLEDRVPLVQGSVAAAQELLRLSQERRGFGVGAVLETIQAEQELTRARDDYLQVVADHNQAQFALKRAIGD